jgi:hypothetical protein
MICKGASKYGEILADGIEKIESCSEFRDEYVVEAVRYTQKRGI